MGGKNKKFRPNGYSLFADMKAKELGITMQEAFGQCASMWEELPKDEKERYKAMAKNGRTSPSSLGIEVGFRTPHQNARMALVQQLDADEQDEEELEAKMIGWIERKVAPKPGEVVNMDSYFVLGHINVYCNPRDKTEPLMPAEVAFARFSLSEGVKETFHALLNLDPLPKIYSYEAQRHAEKLHHIPARTAFGEQEAAKVKRDLAAFLRDEPVFVTDTYKDQNQRENMTRFFADSIDLAGPEVYDLPSLLASMETSVVSLRPETEVVGHGPWMTLIGHAVKSPSAAERYFEDDPFLFKTKSNEGCSFHWAIDHGQYCSLNIVKRRVYAIWAKAGRRALMPESGSLAGLEIEGTNVPVAVEVLPDEMDQAVIAYREVACQKEFVNAFGQQVTRAGTMNGQVNLNPESDPSSLIREMRDKQDELSFTQNVSSEEQQYRRALRGNDDDDDDSTSVTTTVTGTETGSVLGPSSDFPSLPTSAMSSEAGGPAQQRRGGQGFWAAPASRGPDSIQSGATTVTTTDSQTSKRKSRLVAKFGV